MTPTELARLIAGGEDSMLEFKRDDVRNHDLAKELVAFLNLEGGIVLLGVEDDGGISGTSRERLEEWVTEVCRAKVTPPVIPLLSWTRNLGAGEKDDVLAVRVPQGPDKPYALAHNNRKTYFVRVGSTSREASREELERLFQASGRLRYGLKPAPGAGLDSFDRRRLRDYFTRVAGADAPADDDVRGWETLLCNLELMTVANGSVVATIDGQLLFGSDPARFVRQSGIRAVCYAGTTPDYATRADEDLRGALTPLGAAGGRIMETSLVEQAWDFMRRNTKPSARIERGRRIDRWEYPEAVFREAVVNALVHRDYSIAGTDVLLAIYADRVEIESPGRLPNTVTASPRVCRGAGRPPLADCRVRRLPPRADMADSLGATVAVLMATMLPQCGDCAAPERVPSGGSTASSGTERRTAARSRLARRSGRRRPR